MPNESMGARLVAVQSALKAPKGQENKFGGYRYRSCEDILEAVKPLLKEHGLLLTVTDEIEGIGGRFYVKATARLCDADGSGCLEVNAYAREADSRKGMDEAQVTGSASSYARKYALNGLFLIDDTKDPDAANDHGRKPARAAQKAASDQAAPDALDAAKRRLWAAEKRYGEAHGMEPMAVHEGVRKRPDYCETAEFFNRVADEFEGEA